MVVVWFEPLEIILYFAEALFNIIEFVNHHVICSSSLVVVDIQKEACNGKDCMRVDLVGEYPSKKEQKHESFCNFVKKCLQMEIS
jgi:hypothetical protein